MRVIPAVVQHLLRSLAERCSKIQRGSGHPRRAGAPDGALDVDKTGTGYGLRSSCAYIISRSPQGLAKIMEVILEVCRAFALTVSAKAETM